VDGTSVGRTTVTTLRRTPPCSGRSLLFSLLCVLPVFFGIAFLDAEEVEKKESETKVDSLSREKLSPKGLVGSSTGLHLDAVDSRGSGEVIDNRRLKELGKDGVLNQGGSLIDPALASVSRDGEEAGTGVEQLLAPGTSEKSPVNLPVGANSSDIGQLRRVEARLRKEMLKADPERKKILRQHIGYVEKRRKAIEGKKKKESPPPKENPE